MAKGWIAGAVVATMVLAGCGGSSGGGSESGDGPAKTTTTAAATTTTEVDAAAAGEEYQAVLETADQAVDDEIAARDDFAAENDLDGAIDSSKDLRNELFDFDAAVRKIDVPEDAASAVNDVLTETGSYIDVLDDYLEVTTISEYNDQLDAESEARVAWYEAANSLATDLGADGVEDEVDASSSSSSSTDDPTSTSSGDEVAAGDVVSTTTASIEVPEGFTGTGFSTIQLEGPNGSSAGIYDVYNDTATTLEAVAKASAEGTAEKSGDDIASGPRAITINGYPAIGYAYEGADGTSTIDWYIEAEDSAGSKWHLLTVVAPNDEIQAAMDAVEAVFPTLEFS